MIRPLVQDPVFTGLAVLYGFLYLGVYFYPYATDDTDLRVASTSNNFLAQITDDPGFCRGSSLLSPLIPCLPHLGVGQLLGLFVFLGRIEKYQERSKYKGAGDENFHNVRLAVRGRLEYHRSNQACKPVSPAFWYHQYMVYQPKKDYDHALAYVFWAWGKASDFTNNGVENGGYYEHRSQTTDLLVDLIKRGNPWAPDPATGRAAADLLWICRCYPPEQFLRVLDACLTHPQAPDPATWSGRPVFDATTAPNQKPKLWINAIVEHPQIKDILGRYVQLGGRLDTVDENGRGVLANCGSRSWEDIEFILALAQSQNANVMGTRNGSHWITHWHHLSTSENSVAQQKIAELAKKYPQATLSQADPIDEIVSLIRQDPGKRIVATAWKNLGIEKIIGKDEKAFERIFNETLNLSLDHILTHLSSTTLPYLAACLAKAAQFHPQACHFQKVLASGFSSHGKCGNSLQLLAGGVCPYPQHADEFSNWFAGLEGLSETLHMVRKNKASRSTKAVTNFINYVLPDFYTSSSSTTPSQRVAFVAALLEDIVQQDGSLAKTRLENVSLLAVLECCEEDLPGYLAEELVVLALDEFPRTFRSAYASFAHSTGALSPPFNNSRQKGTTWMVNRLEEYAENGAPHRIVKALEKAHDDMWEEKGAFSSVTGLEETFAYLGQLRLRLQVQSNIVNSSRASLLPKM